MSSNEDFEWTGSDPGESWSISYIGKNTETMFDWGDVKWIETPIPSPSDYPMVEVFCKCRASIGKVGLPAKQGASMIQVEFKCADCGETTWWRSAR